MNKPSTIIYPATFDRHPSAGFDGLFDWTWTQGCFGDTKITPMDFDGVIERNRHFMVIETKEEGKEIPLGQLITLNNLRCARSFTVMKIWGKSNPTRIELILHNGNGKPLSYEGSEARNILMKWFEWANRNKEA